MKFHCQTVFIKSVQFQVFYLFKKKILILSALGIDQTQLSIFQKQQWNPGSMLDRPRRPCTAG